MSRSKMWRVLFFLVGMLYLGSVAAYGTDAVPFQGDANGYAIIINLPARELHLYRHGVPTKTYSIGVGTIVSPSRLGPTQIINMVRHPTYYPPDWYTRGLSPIPPGPNNPVGTRWLGLGWSGYGIHGTNNPDSIGRAASAGCIRMHNADVEELADWVSIGTPVYFVYETVEVWRDSLTGQPLLKVHPDVYGMGTRTIKDTIHRLAARGISVDQLSGPGLTMLLAEASGVPSALPIDLPILWEGVELIQSGFRIGNRQFVSLHRLARQIGDGVFWDRRDDVVTVNGHKIDEGVWIDNELYTTPEVAGAALGLGRRRFTSSQGEFAEEFYCIGLTYDGTELPFRAILDGSWLLVPTDTIEALLQIEVSWDSTQNLVMLGEKPLFMGKAIGDRYYLPHDRLADLVGIEVDWQSGDRTARLRLREARRLPAADSWRSGDVPEWY